MEGITQTIKMNNLSKELRKYGFAQTSQEAIAQAGNIYGGPEAATPETDTVQLTRAQFNELVSKMQKLWQFKEASDQKISVIAEQLVKVTDKLNEVIKSISMIEMNQAVFDKKLNVLKERGISSDHEQPQSQQSHSREHVEEPSAREREAPRKLDKPIDRNGVAPASVSIEKMFYCGNK